MTECVVISDTSPLAVHINARLNSMDYSSKLITVDYRGNDPSVINLILISSRWLWFLRRLRSYFYRHFLLNVNKKYQYYQDIDDDKHYFPIDSLIKNIGQPKYIFILFNYRVLTSMSIRRIYEKTNATIFWLMPDMSPITGGCSYSYECSHYQNGCVICPAILNRLNSNFANATLYKKIKNLDGTNIIPIACSTELKAQIGKSLLFRKHKVIECFFPIDETIFYPGDIKVERSNLGLPQDAKVIFFGAAKVSEKRKGFSHLIEAIRLLCKFNCIQNLHLVIAGQTDNLLDDISSLIPITKMGMVNHEILSQLYRAADLFVCPSLADSGPTMVNQSILCGTPVVAFDVGVSIDLVKDGHTGYLAKDRSSDGLATAIHKFFLHSEAEQIKIKINCINLRKEMIKHSFFNVIKDYIKK
jgi:glycosyltransferase involved in cell wall biosynthesis